MTLAERYTLGALVYVPGTVITSLPELHRKYGDKPKLVWFPGIVTACDIVLSSKGRKQKYVTAAWCYGNGLSKVKQVSVSQTLLKAPDGSFLPQDVQLIEESLLWRPPPKKKRDKNGVLIEEADEDAIPMSQLVQLPTDEEFAALPSPMQGVRASSLDCVELGIAWKDDDEATQVAVNGPCPRKTWSMRDTLGNVYSEGSDTVRLSSLIDYFLLMFPPRALAHFLECTNLLLEAEEKEHEPVSYEEAIKFFGIIILATRFEFTSRASLWSTATLSRFYSLPGFGRSGMPRARFDAIWRCMRFSYQPPERPPHLGSEDYRWKLVGDFVELFNDHREEFFTPCDRICVDESISRWYGLGGDWINAGLPMYVAMERKPENGAEIQNACCADSGVMIRMRVRKTKATDSLDLDPETNHGTGVLRDLVIPWAHTSRVVVADSFFASVEAAQVLFRLGIRFIGVVKTATKRFPMAALGSVQFPHRGMWKGLIHRGDKAAGHADLLAFTWNDTNRRMFISSVSSLMPSSLPIQRPRLRQVDKAPNADPQDVYQCIEQPKASAMYYTSAARIDQHNRTRQADLAIERKLVTHRWYKRVSLSIFSMIVVDAYLLFKKATGSEDTPATFFHKLAEEMIDFERTTRLQRSLIREAESAAAAAAVADSFASRRLTPTKRSRGDGAGNKTRTPGSSAKKTYKHQAKCVVCSKKTTWTCSECRDQGVMVYVCHTTTRAGCWPAHGTEVHCFD
jgi:hypothetical protein